MVANVKEILAQIQAPTFTAGLILWNDRVVETAPKLKYMRKWRRAQVRAYCQAQDWKIIVVHTIERTP